MSTVIPVDASGKQGEIEVATVLTTQDSLAQLAHDTALISWIAEIGVRSVGYTVGKNS